jgi:iron(III) transport system permease protein
VLFLPLAVGAVRAAVAHAPPVLEDVARSLGRGRAATQFRVTIPLAAPGVLAGAALVFLTVVKELPMALILGPIGFETLATEIWTATSAGFYSRAAVPALLLILASAPLVHLVAVRGAAPPEALD